MAKTTPDKTQQADDVGTTVQTSPEVPVSEQVAPNPVPADSSNPDNSPAGSSNTSGDTQASSDKIAESVQQAVAPILAVDSSSELKAKVNSVLGGVGETPAPTMVNGRDVTGMKLADDGESYVPDPDYSAPAAARPADIFDRIGNAVQHESLRLVLEEIVHWMFGSKEAAAKETLVLPEGMNNLKSTASIRTDVTGYGAYAGSDTTGPAVAETNPDGSAAVAAPEAKE